MSDQQRIKDLEDSNEVIVKVCIDLIDKCVSLQKQVDRLSCNYLRHHYSHYHLTKDKNGKITALKPELSLEDDLLLELVNRKVGKSDIMDYYRPAPNHTDSLGEE